MRLESAHSTLRRSAAVKLQSHVRRYLTIKRWPRSGSITPSQSYLTYSSVVSQPHNGEVCTKHGSYTISHYVLHVRRRHQCTYLATTQ